jgi:hypothetical protein
MAVANTLAYYNAAIITTVKSFTERALGGMNIVVSCYQTKKKSEWGGGGGAPRRSA